MTYPIYLTDREKEIDGRSNAQNAKSMRLKEQIDLMHSPAKPYMKNK